MVKPAIDWYHDCFKGRKIQAFEIKNGQSITEWKQL